jgi:hypothetical protein
MRATTFGPLAASGLLLAACGATQTSGVVAIGPDTYAVETRGRALGTAVERGLTEATNFCTVQGRQTELQGTRINPDSYQVVFRCAGSAPGGIRGFTPPAAAIAGAQPITGAGFATRPSRLGPVPISPAPVPAVSRGPGGTVVMQGQAFATPAAPPPGLGEGGTIPFVQPQPARVTGNPFASAPAAAPRRDTLPSPAQLSAMMSPGAAPTSAFAPPAFAPQTGASAPPVLSPMQPLQSPLAPSAMPAAAALPSPSSLPAFQAPPPSPAAFQPLQSPLAPGAAPAFQPLQSPAGPAPVAAPPPAFQPLPPARSALPTISGGGPLPVAGPASVPALAPVSGGGDSTSVIPPALPILSR